MKALVLLAIGSIIFIIYGCATNDSSQENAPVIAKIPIQNGLETSMNIRLYVIDSCEYIGFLNGCKHDFLTHKGNCKHCAKH